MLKLSMIILFNFFTFLAFLFLSLETYFYPGVVYNKIGIGASIFTIFYLTLALILSAKNIKLYSSTFKKINNKFIFPVLSIFYIIILFLEKTQHPNFVFTHFHIHRLMFFYLTSLSGMIFYITYPNFKEKRNRIIYYLLPLLLIFLYLIYTISPNFFYQITREDNLLECLQFIFYFTSAIFSFKLYKLFKQKNNKLNTWIFLLLSIGLFFVAFEEISWGQRIFGIDTPDSIKEINFQNELSIHNLEIFQHFALHTAYLFIAFYGMFSQIILRKFFYKKYKHLLIFTPPFYLFFSFFTLASVYIIHDYFQFLYLLTPTIYTNFVLSQEIAETYLAIAFLIYTYTTFKKVKQYPLIHQNSLHTKA